MMRQGAEQRLVSGHWIFLERSGWRDQEMIVVMMIEHATVCVL